jgi:iron complex outermembrane receptor protein
MSRSIRARLARLLAPALLVLALPAVAAAQAGRITGTVTDPEQRSLGGATVQVVELAIGATSEANGRYVIRNVLPGTYTVRVTRLGSMPVTVTNVVVTAGQDAVANATMSASTVQLGGVVVSASRRVEKITEAPASVTRIDATAIANTIGNSFAPALKAVPGLDFIQVGMTAVAVNARGFNSSFNNRMLMMEDNRIAVLPENGLPVGGFTTIPKVDLAGVEVLVGPGAALYGADASNGVITLQTKDPRDYRGITAEISTGSRGFFDAQFRWADMFGKFGVKVTGETQSADDWQNRLTYAPIAPGATEGLPEIGASFRTDVVRGGLTGVYYFDRGGRLELTGGASRSNGLGQTNVGRNQLVDWEYRNLQAKYTSPRWFAQAYQTQSRSGGTFQLNGFTQNSARFPAISEDSAKALSDFPAVGKLRAAELQNNFDLGSLVTTGARALDDTRIVWGGQYRQDIVTSKRQWLSDRNTGEDIEIGQLGGYLQTETPLTNRLRLILAGRYDKHDNYDAQFSPKAAITFSPVPDQTLRVSFNRAFKSPSLLQTDFYFPNFSPSVGIFGNKRGFEVRDGSNAIIATIDPIRPEINNTWEFGYKGVIKQRLFVDAVLYRSRYEDFLSPLYVFANPFAGTTGTYPGGEPIYTDPQVALTYLNIGEATITGTDLGLRYYLTDRVVASGNVSFLKLDDLEAPTTGPLAGPGAEATAFNSPSTKWNVGMDFIDMIPRSAAGFTLRYVQGYEFRSGVNRGFIPTFGTLDLAFSHRLPWEGLRLTAQVQNLFSCTSGSFVPAQWVAAANTAGYDKGQECGFNKEHIEMVNAPSIGTMLFLGLRFEGLQLDR